MSFQQKVAYPFGPAPEGVDVLWRADAVSYSYIIDPDADLYGVSDPRLEITWWRVKRWTRCGARLASGKYVNLDKRISRREWASRTPAEAVTSLQARRRRQIAILQGKVVRAQAELALTEGAIL